MNRKQRMKNRDTALALHLDCTPPCPNCGTKGPHWVGAPQTLADVINNTAPIGFWVCPSLYDDEGRRRET